MTITTMVTEKNPIITPLTEIKPNDQRKHGLMDISDLLLWEYWLWTRRVRDVPSSWKACTWNREWPTPWTCPCEHVPSPRRLPAIGSVLRKIRDPRGRRIIEIEMSERFRWLHTSYWVVFLTVARLAAGVGAVTMKLGHNVQAALYVTLWSRRLTQQLRFICLPDLVVVNQILEFIGVDDDMHATHLRQAELGIVHASEAHFLPGARGIGLTGAERRQKTKKVERAWWRRSTDNEIQDEQEEIYGINDHNT